MARAAQVPILPQPRLEMAMRKLALCRWGSMSVRAVSPQCGLQGERRNRYLSSASTAWRKNWVTSSRVKKVVLQPVRPGWPLHPGAVVLGIMSCVSAPGRRRKPSSGASFLTFHRFLPPTWLAWGRPALSFQALKGRGFPAPVDELMGEAMMGLHQAADNPPRLFAQRP